MPLMVRSACLTGYVETARALGVDPFAELRRARISPLCLEQPDTKIAVESVGRLLESSAAAAGAEDFGLRMAETRQLSNLGPLALVMREEPTIRKALESVRRYLHLHNEAISMIVEDVGDVAVIREEYMRLDSRRIRQAAELSLAVLCRCLRVLLGPSWRAERVCFRHGAPRSTASHRRVFGTRVEFDADFDGLVCRAADLERPTPNADPVAARQIRQYLDSLSEQYRAGTADTVRELVWLLLPTGRCSIEQVAKHLGVTRRTVHRQLAAQGQTYSAILDEVRGGLAERLVANRDRPLADVAELLGFSAPSAFSRWFAQRAGCSASAWRARQRAARLPRPTPPRSRKSSPASP